MPGDIYFNDREKGLELSSIVTTDPPIAEACILLVEDYEPNRLVAHTFLEEFGYICDIASNGIEAVEKVKTGYYVAVLLTRQINSFCFFAKNKIFV